MLKLLLASVSIFMLSGCCELFGICTSVSVNSSISSPRQFARADSLPAADTEQLALANAALQPQTVADSCSSNSR